MTTNGRTWLLRNSSPQIKSVFQGAAAFAAGVGTVRVPFYLFVRHRQLTRSPRFLPTSFQSTYLVRFWHYQSFVAFRLPLSYTPLLLNTFSRVVRGTLFGAWSSDVLSFLLTFLRTCAEGDATS